MWRGIPFIFVLAACGQGHKGSKYTLLVDKTVTVASDGPSVQASGDSDDEYIPPLQDKIEHLTAPALAVDERGLLLAWELQRRIEGEQSRVVAQRLSLDAEPVGSLIEVGKGMHPSTTTSSQGYVVAWIDTWADASITLAHIAADGSLSRPVIAAGAPASGTASLVASGDAVTAIACSNDDNKLVVVHATHGEATVEQQSLKAGCSAPIASKSGRPIALIPRAESGSTTIIDLGAPSSVPVESSAYCFAVMNVVDAPTLVCLDKAFGSSFSFIQTREGRRALADKVPINVRPRGEVVEARAVAISQGIILAWTTVVKDETQLSAALVNKNGEVLAADVVLRKAPKLPVFDLVGRGSTAWLAFVTEEQSSQDLYKHNVVVARLRVTGR